MQRIQLETNTAVSVGATTDVMVSIEGGACRLYTGSAPTDQKAGHYVTAGYQIIVPVGVDVYATAEAGAQCAAIVGVFGV